MSMGIKKVKDCDYYVDMEEYYNDESIIDIHQRRIAELECVVQDLEEKIKTLETRISDLENKKNLYAKKTRHIMDESQY